MKNINIMIDLETLSTHPTAAIISLGAVMFTEDRIVGKELYDVDVQEVIDKGFHVDVETLKWWMNQDKVTQKANLNGSWGIEDALDAFMRDILMYGSDSILIWSNGASFDIPILKNAINVTVNYDSDVSFEILWRYNQEMCYRTISKLYPDVEWEGVNNHIALSDAINQANHLIKIGQKYKVVGDLLKFGIDYE